MAFPNFGRGRMTSMSIISQSPIAIVEAGAVYSVLLKQPKTHNNGNMVYQITLEASWEIITAIIITHPCNLELSSNAIVNRNESDKFFSWNVSKRVRKWRRASTLCRPAIENDCCALLATAVSSAIKRGANKARWYLKRAGGERHKKMAGFAPALWREIYIAATAAKWSSYSMAVTRGRRA